MKSFAREKVRSKNKGQKTYKKVIKKIKLKVSNIFSVVKCFMKKSVKQKCGAKPCLNYLKYFQMAIVAPHDV